ncbi:hypothetical protein SAMN04515674_102379 [Pseudarcicella hirudinis]|uniref:Lipocalin-like domain-containing protein n=1 Tax=Pseudarcicella hirudinis TaxID=1079859 RepID=A0A1I5PAU3_9BACT|nr:hypothetical protein [Pseudarcicella hirudinis]SFP31234.1 hypothetical protein SAMN04515674_102379 [Pseudarcicella hirudinis]
MKKYSILVFLFVITFVMSCKKDDPTPTPTKTKTEIISAHSWQIKTALAFGVSVYEKGGTGNQRDFSKVVLNFKSDGTITGTDTDGISFNSAKWVFTSGETKITLSSLPISILNNVTFDITQLVEGNFDLSGTITYNGTAIPGVVKLIP